jgi:hypothetical protein
LLHIKPTTLNEMIKRHDIRPRRKRIGQGNGVDSTDGENGGSTIAGPIVPASAFDEK